MLKDKLVHYRELKNYSIEDFASKINKPVEEVFSWEKGENNPTLEEVYKICEIYDIPVDHLLSKYEKEYTYKIKKKISSDNIVLILCIIGISIPTLVGFIFLIRMTVRWINGGTFF